MKEGVGDEDETLRIRSDAIDPRALDAPGVSAWILSPFVSISSTELEQPLWRISRHTVLYPEEQRLPEDLAIASQEFKEMAAVLEKHMRGREFVAGDSATVADFVFAYTLDWGNEIKLLGDRPQLRAYMKRMYARPSAPLRIAEAFAAISAQQNSADGDL